MEIAHAAEHWRVLLNRDRQLTHHPAEQVVLLRVEKTLILIELSVGEVADMGVGEPAHDQVDLADTAMPRAKQHLATPFVEAFARSGASRHAVSKRQKP